MNTEFKTLDEAVNYASFESDLDDAVRIIQNFLGVKTGDYAAQWFSGHPENFDADFQAADNWADIWPELADHQRANVLSDYAEDQIEEEQLKGKAAVLLTWPQRQKKLAAVENALMECGIRASIEHPEHIQVPIVRGHYCAAGFNGAGMFEIQHQREDGLSRGQRPDIAVSEGHSVCFLASDIRGYCIRLRANIEHEVKEAFLRLAFSVIQTGGGCEAWRTVRDGKAYQITSEGDPSLPDSLDEPCTLVELELPSDEQLGEPVDFPSVRACLEAFGPERVPGAKRLLIAAAKKAEDFISGFEDDETQEGIPELLSELRTAIANAEVEK